MTDCHVSTAAAASLVSLAENMRLDPLAAVALPSVVTVAARKAGLSDAALVAECAGNHALREYLAGVCRSIDVRAALV